MQKLINRPEDVVSEAIEGLLALQPGLARLDPHHVLMRRDFDDARDRQVALISGGGSGHEPAHAGYVGPGMLSAAVAGEVFTSPGVEAIGATLRAVAGRLGALLIVKNYTGDRLNFGLAAEIARSEGLLVETVVIADDVALARSEDHAGRRGLAGAVLIHKVAGAAAAQGFDLPQVASIAQQAANELATMGVALSPVTPPGVDKPPFTLDGELELGLGIHGEAGVRRIALRPADEIVDRLLDETLSALRARAGDRWAVLVNNLGGSSQLEIAIAGRRVERHLAEQGAVLERLYAGAFLTSLNMAGLSISLLRVDDQRLRWLDAPTTAAAWPRTSKEKPLRADERTFRLQATENASTPRVPIETLTESGRLAARVLAVVCEALEASESHLTALDQATGDGDLGQSMSRAVRGLRESWTSLPFDHVPQLLRTLGLRLQEQLGGSSGPLYGVLLLRAGSALEAGPRGDLRHWAAAVLEGCGAVGELGGARLGDRTMLDALVPFGQELAGYADEPDALQRAARAARAGAERTAQMTARRGRSSYLGKRVLGHRDPGAVAVAIWLEALTAELAAAR